jgi:hypothetical protein
LVSIDSLTNARVNWSEIYVGYWGWLEEGSCRWPVPLLIQDGCHTFPRLQRAKYFLLVANFDTEMKWPLKFNYDHQEAWHTNYNVNDLGRVLTFGLVSATVSLWVEFMSGFCLLQYRHHRVVTSTFEILYNVAQLGMLKVLCCIFPSFWKIWRILSLSWRPKRVTQL